MAFSIRLSEEERQLADSYAKLHSMSMGEAFKRALFDKIEEEYDNYRCRGSLRRVSAQRKEEPPGGRVLEGTRLMKYRVENDAAI